MTLSFPISVESFLVIISNGPLYFLELPEGFFILKVRLLVWMHSRAELDARNYCSMGFMRVNWA